MSQDSSEDKYIVGNSIIIKFYLLKVLKNLKHTYSPILEYSYFQNLL